MQKKIDEHQFVGMQRDMTISKQKPEFLWDAHNIRLTARHGDTLLSMTNERGTKQISNVEIKGVVLGYCVLGDYLTVFTHEINPEDQSECDHIYRIEKTNTGFKSKSLYDGNLNFNQDHPIETLGVYENIDILKVYWTDGINLPRFINITKPIVDRMYTDTSFDFIPELKLEDSIHVEKVADSSGVFAAGVIQYAVTYYYKYGQESNISVVSPLIPTSYTSRAGGPEDTIGNAFKVTVKNPDTLFEFMRIYSIFRSSKNTTPVCKRVADVRLGYGGNSPKTLYTSGLEKETNYARIDIDSSFQSTEFKTTIDGNFSNLQSSGSQYIGTETVKVNGVTFNGGLYYHFSKEDYPNLIIKADIFWTIPNSQVEGHGRRYFTWGDCTDIYISTGEQSVPGPGSSAHELIWSVGPDGNNMVMAEDMHYQLSEFIIGDSITITDNGTIGEDIDNSELLFVGGEEITAGTMTQKDGTLFLGDINIKRKQIDGDLSSDSTGMADEIKDATSIDDSHRTCWFPITMNSSTYKWGNTLDAHIGHVVNNEYVKDKYSTNIAGFKRGEHYRLGLQFQYKTGKWSQPIFISDETMPTDANLSLWIDEEAGYCKQNIPTFNAELGATIGQKLADEGYKRVRAVVCFPTESDQLILCLGLINPTVHSISGRVNHTPDVQSSWFFRPVPRNEIELNSYERKEGGVVQFKNGYTLHSGQISSVHAIIPERDDEIQSAHAEFSNKLAINIFGENYDYIYDSEYDPNNPTESHLHSLPEINITSNTIGSHGGDTESTPPFTAYDTKDLNDVFVVDWQYLTFHSPDIEFNDSFYNMDTTTIGCRLIGRYLVGSNHGDIHISTSSTTISNEAPGFYHRIVQTQMSGLRINSGLFYKDSRVKTTGQGYAALNNNVHYTYLIYPWHREGSLNNDSVRSEQFPGRSAVLKQKKLINIMYFNQMIGFNESTDENDTLTFRELNIEHPTEGQQSTYDTADIKIFNSDQVSLVKLNNMNYFGNVDQVLTPCYKYRIGYSPNGNFVGDIYSLPYAESTQEEYQLCFSADPIYMKYKSSPHAVIYTTTEFVNEIPEGESLGTHQVNLSTQYEFEDHLRAYLYCAEMYRSSNSDTDFGGTSSHAIQHNLWYPAGPPVKIGCTVDGTATQEGTTVIPFWYGDTYYQRYDCLKTYPFTDEDSNSIIEIGSFMVETRINIDGRYDKHRGDTSSFLINPTNYNLINPVYSLMDNFFNYRILDADYYALNDYPTMVSWTGYKNNAAEVDNWTNITLASTLEMDGTKGRVNAIRVNSDQLYCFQNDAIGLILFNSRVQISPSDGVPIEISNNYKVDGNRYISTTIGCKNKWTIIEGIDGLYFIDDNTKALYQIGGQSQMKPISAPLNMSYWFMNQSSDAKWIQRYYDGNWEMPQRGIRCFYDKANADLYICTPDETLCYSEKLGQFISFFDYHNVIGMFNIDSEYYALNYSDIIPQSGIKLWGMFQGLYNCIFDKIYPTDFTFISNENPLNDKIFTNIDLRGDFRLWYHNDIKEDFNSPTHIVDHVKMFDTLQVWNEYQDTGITDLNFTKDAVSNMKKKFRIWRMDIPRDKSNSINRIRNTWAKVKFTMNTLSDVSLQDLCGTVTDEFIVWDSNSMSWTNLDFRNREGHEFAYNEEGGYIQEDELNAEHFHSVYQYRLNGNVITRTIAGQTSITQQYAYRKLYDMEIHDIGVVYFV